MVLSVDSDGAYLVATQAIVISGGYDYLNNKQVTLFNGTIYVLEEIIKISWDMHQKLNLYHYI